MSRDGQYERQDGARAVVPLAITLRQVTGSLLLVALVLSIVSLIALLSVHLLGDFPLKAAFIRLADVNGETSVATWFSASLLAICAVVLAMISVASKRGGGKLVPYWTVLCLVFLYLSVDEAARIHEESNALRTVFGVGGFLYYTWVIPGAVLISIFALSYLRFFLALPPDTRRLMFVAGTLFVGGALGLEFAGGWLTDSSGKDTMMYGLVTHAEELLEMVGAIIFLHALMSYIVWYVGDIRISLSSSPQAGLTGRRGGSYLPTLHPVKVHTVRPSPVGTDPVDAPSRLRR